MQERRTTMGQIDELSIISGGKAAVGRGEPAPGPVAALENWVVTSGLSGMAPPDLLDGFCRRLREAGLTVQRGHIAFNTLHPQVRAFSYTWRADRGVAEGNTFGHGDAESPEWRRSPFHFMLSNRIGDMRRRLVGPEAQLDFAALEDFRAGGATDWLALLYPFGWDDMDADLEHAIGLISSWTTDATGGFRETDLALLRRLLPQLALAVKASATRAMANTLLSTYLGADAGTRVLRGDIRRGDVDSLHAVLLLADLRGFTRLADETPRDELAKMLDDYLECMTVPVQRHGGQVLKFLGDGLLATFDIGARPTCSDICATSLTAAHDALAAVADLNRRRQAEGRPTMQLDIALHMGDVLYGNFGAPDRLEFTVIGPAVNEVARIESLCQELDSNLLISETFAAAATGCRPRLRSLGPHRLRGVRQEQELFTWQTPASN